MTWGSSKWGEGTEDLQVAVEKVLTNAITPDSTITTLREIQLTIANALALATDVSNEGLSDGGGWNYIFVKPTTNADDRTAVTYAEQSTSAQSYTCAAAANITWS
jgi:hypothetical protein